MAPTQETATGAGRVCAGPDCEERLEGRQPGCRYCSDRCRKGAHRALARGRRQAPGGQEAAATTRRTRALRADPVHLAAEAASYARDLRAEAERSLRQDGSRWPWRRTTEVPDRRHRIGQGQGAKP